MQPTSLWQEQTIARFMYLSRLHFGLINLPAVPPPNRLAARLRPIFRSLVIACSLGSVVGSPAYAAPVGRQAGPPPPIGLGHVIRRDAENAQEPSWEPSRT